MKYVNLGCLVLFGAVPAAAQSKRLFPEAKCSYTLPGPDWEWVDLKGKQLPGGETLAVARKQSGAVFLLQVEPVRAKPGRGVCREFRAGLERSKKARAVGSYPVLFHGVPAYHVDVVGAGGQPGSVRAVYANDRLYTLHVVTRPGDPSAEAEATAAYVGFEFIGPPQAMLQPEDLEGEEDGAKELGERAGGTVARWLLGPAGLVLLIIFGAWMIIWVRR